MRGAADDAFSRATQSSMTTGALQFGMLHADERSTNAIGTAIAEGAPTLVHAGEHYLGADHILTCSAAPIFDPRGAVISVLDVAGDCNSYRELDVIQSHGLAKKRGLNG